MKKIILCLIVFVVCSCAPTVFYKDGATQADFKRDSYGCEKDARQSGYYGQGLAGAINMKQFYRRCMEACGYEVKE